MPGYVEGKDKNEILTALVGTAEAGVFNSGAADEELGRQRHALAPLVFAGQGVITL